MEDRRLATITEALQLARQHHLAGRLAPAEQICRRILTVEPAHPEAVHLLALVAFAGGDVEAAISLLSRAIAASPDNAQFHIDLGVLLRRHGRLNEAVECLLRAVELQPDSVDALHNLGLAFRNLGAPARAMECYRRALAINPCLAETQCNLGRLLLDEGRAAEAIVCCQRAIEFNPLLAEAQNNLGAALVDQGKIDEGVAHYRRALELKPDFVEAQINLGSALKEQGMVAQAITFLRQALQLRPDYAAARSQLIYALHYCPGYTPEQLCAEARQWNQHHAEPLARFIRPHLNDRSPNRRLRLGYVSPDFHAHVVAMNLLPILRNHDHNHFEVFCYSSTPRPDGITARLRESADAWRDTSRLDAQQAAAAIHQDRIDILVDLALHTGGDQLSIFARKPTPVQVTFAGYPGTTGLSAIDYRLTDPYLDPPGVGDHYYTEESVRLPNTFWCYEPVSRDVDLTPLPAFANGYVTFGRLSSFSKVSDQTLRWWAGVLNRVRGSRLMMLADEGSHRQRTLDVLRAEGVGPERVEFVAKQSGPQYLGACQRMDIGLDTFPYNGHTSSLDSFWMGVPVVTFAGSTAVARGGLSILSNLQLPELVARSPEHFVQIAVDLAHDLPRLAALRATLRSRMEASPLMDHVGFTRDLEAAYRAMWQRWCKTA